MFFKSKEEKLISNVIEGDFEKVKKLLANGADINAKNKYNGGTALISAAEGGHTEIVKALLANGADVNVKAKDGQTALIRAARMILIGLVPGRITV